MDPNQPSQPSQPGQPSAPAPNPVQTPVATNQSKGLAIAALVVGIVAFLSGWAPVWGLIVGIVAVILGIVALVKKQHKVMSVIGLVLGAIGLISSLLFTLFWGAVFTSPDVQNALEDANNQSQSEMTSDKWSADEANAAYEKVTNGMNKDTVETAVGREAESCTEFDSDAGVSETCSYGNMFTDDVSFSVTFTDGVVTSKMKNS